MPSRYDVDTSQFPVVFSVMFDDMDLGEFDRMIGRYYDYVLARNEPYVSIIDARELHKIPPARVRRIIAEQRRRAMGLGVGRLIRGFAVITTNRLLNSVVSVVDWVAPLTNSWTVAATKEDAVAWAYERLRSTGSMPPPARSGVVASPNAAPLDPAAGERDPSDPRRR